MQVADLPFERILRGLRLARVRHRQHDQRALQDLADAHRDRPLRHGVQCREPALAELLLPAGFVEIDDDIGLLGLEIGRRIDLCFAGIGENCHLAFNDPPADFETEKPYIVVDLDEACRQQQFGEGWFPTLDSVPKRAISMSIRQILKSALIVLSVSDTRKAQAAKDALEGEVSNLHPASILQTHPNTVLFIDPPAASLLRKRG